MNQLRLVALEATNFKRIVAMRIEPTGAVTKIIGKNGAGKSSALDAIAAAIGGAVHAPDMPIQKGKLEATVSVDLDEFKITRKWRASGANTMTITDREGHTPKKAQALLDSFMGRIGFDPLEFGRLAPKDQAKLLAGLIGVDLEKYEQQRVSLYAERTARNKVAASEKHKLANTPIVNAPDAPVDTKALAEKLQQANRHNATIDARKQDVEAAERLGTAKAALVDRERDKLAALRKELDLAELRVRTAEQDHTTATERHAELAAEFAAFSREDVAPIMKEIAEAGETNRAVAEKKARKAAAEAAEAAQAAADRADTDYKEHVQTLATTLATAALPVPGLAFSESTVTLNGVPFGQCSAAEQLRTSVGVGLALNPKLKLILIRDGSLLDDAGMELLADLAVRHDAQVIIERVAGGGETGILIEDGEVVSLPTEEEVKAPAKRRGAK